MMLGRILAVNSVDMAGLEANRLGKIPGDLEKRAAEAGSRRASRARHCGANWPPPRSDWRQQATLAAAFLSANDRSRWCTVRALVEDDMRMPGAPYAIDKVIQERNWDTIDMVKHDGHLYSSKPPLMPTLMAAVYWPIYRFTGATLGTHPYEIDWLMLVLFNLVPLVIGFALLARLVERFGTTDWGRIFVMAAAAFGTFLTTFAVTINNHLPAAVCAVAAVYAAVRIWFDGERRLRYFVVAGLFAALAAANEFPAASILAAVARAAALEIAAPVAARVSFRRWRVVAAAFFGTEWIAHHNLKPAYLHRSGGDNWYDYTYERNGRTIESYWRHPAGARSRRAVARGLRVQRVGRPSRHLLADADLAAELPGHGRVDVPPRRRAAAAVGGGDGRHLAGLHSILFEPAADAAQLRRRHERLSLGVLARAALAA